MLYDRFLKTLLRLSTIGHYPPDEWSAHWLSHGSPQPLDHLKPLNGGVHATHHVISAFFMGLRHLHPLEGIYCSLYQLESGVMRYFISASQAVLQSSMMNQPVFIHLCDQSAFTPIPKTYPSRIVRYSSGRIKGPNEWVSTQTIRPYHVFAMRLSDLAVTEHADHERRQAARLFYRWRLARFT